MRRLGKLAVCLLSVALMAMGTGCGGSKANSNGDSGSIISTLSKLANPDANIGALNSAELQILVTQLPALIEQMPQLGIELPAGVELPELTDAQAEALEDFLDANEVNTFEDLGDLTLLVEGGQVQIPPELQTLWDGFAAQFGRPRPSA